MKIVDWFKLNILGIKPIFKIKIEKTYFSDNWFNIKFSKDNGFSWEYILDYAIDIDSPCDELKIVKDDIPLERIESMVKQFTTYSKCIEYNEQILNTVHNTNEERRTEYIKKKNKINTLIAKVNNQ